MCQQLPVKCWTLYCLSGCLLGIANEKQKVRVKKIKAETERLKDGTGGNSEADDWVAAMMGEISENESEEDFQCVYTLGSGQPM